MSRNDFWHRKFSIGRHFQNGRHNTAQIQHCSISKVAFNLFFKPVVCCRFGRLHNRWIIIISCLYFIYMQRLAIQFVEMHCTRTHICFFFIYINQHPGNNCVLFIELFITPRKWWNLNDQSSYFRGILKYNLLDLHSRKGHDLWWRF